MFTFYDAKGLYIFGFPLGLSFPDFVVNSTDSYVGHAEWFRAPVPITLHMHVKDFKLIGFFLKSYIGLEIGRIH